MALDYGYTIQIQSNGTSDPSHTPTNQWQRKLSGQPNFTDLDGETGNTYVVKAADQSSEIRLSQDFGGSKAYSNELQVTSDSPIPSGYKELYVSGGTVKFYQFWVKEKTNILREDLTVEKVCEAGIQLTHSFRAGTYLIPCHLLTKTFQMRNSSGVWEFGPGFNIGEVTDLSDCFRAGNYHGNQIREWDVSKVTNMAYFAYMTSSSGGFSTDITNWDISNVTNFKSCFYRNTGMNYDYSKWNPRSGQDFSSIFYYCDAFDQDLSGWCVENATSVGAPFAYTPMATKTEWHPKWGQPCA